VDLTRDDVTEILYGANTCRWLSGYCLTRSFFTDAHRRALPAHNGNGGATMGVPSGGSKKNADGNLYDLVVECNDLIWMRA
jgi:hypothetical protein